MYRLVILDFDGTIADTATLITSTMQATLRELGLPEATPEACRQTIGLPLADCFRALMPLTDAQASRCAEVYRRRFALSHRPSVVPVFPGAVEAIRRWHRRGTVVTIASSRGHQSLQDFVSEMHLGPYISLILGHEDVARAKPDPCPVLQTLAHLGIDAADTLVVGDMRYDILMGARAGCHTCGVTYGNGTPRQLLDAGAELLVGSLTEIEG